MNQSQKRIRPTRIRRNTDQNHGCVQCIASVGGGEIEEEEEEEEAVFIGVVNTHEDPPNAHQAQHRPVQDAGAMSA